MVIDMDEIPEKCMNCKHSSVMFENVHQGWNNYQLEYVVRCDCSIQHYRVGCVCAEIYCEKKGGDNNE